MGFRFRKTVNLGKGVRFNISKSGVSTSIGPRGSSISFGKRGTYANLGIPGTGISYRKRIDKSRDCGRNSSNAASNAAIDRIAEYTNSPDFTFSVVVADSGELLFLDSSGGVITDKKLIGLLKQHPQFKQSKESLESAALENSKAYADRVNGTTEACVHLYRKASKIRSLNDFENRKAMLEAELQMLNTSAGNEEQRRCRNSVRNIEAALDGNKSYIEWGAQQWFERSSIPFPASASFEYMSNEAKLMVDLDLPEIEAMPQTFCTQMSSGLFKEKNKTQKRLNEDYSQTVLGFVVYVASGMFNISPRIENVVISGFTQRRDSGGSITPEYIVSVKFTRDEFSSQEYSSCNPVAVILSFENRLKLLQSNSFKRIEPFQ